MNAAALGEPARRMRARADRVTAVTPAGEYRAGYMDGAVQSGQRAAAEVLARLA
jgi:monoamine oxidase